MMTMVLRASLNGSLEVKAKKCFYCQKEGHFIKECFKKKRYDREKLQESGVLTIALWWRGLGCV